MTQEDKDLLLKYLCMALPYKVVIEYNNDGCSSTRELGLGSLHDFICDNAECKPYLRPMSSMTEEEKGEIALIRNRDFQSVKKWIHNEAIKETGDICPITFGEIDYCHKKHFDYRGLIPMGLALEASENIYNVK